LPAEQPHRRLGFTNRAGAETVLKKGVINQSVRGAEKRHVFFLERCRRDKIRVKKKRNKCKNEAFKRKNPASKVTGFFFVQKLKTSVFPCD
jgi:hypothetical protein